LLPLREVSQANQRQRLDHPPHQVSAANLRQRLRRPQQVSSANLRQRLLHPQQVSSANLRQRLVHLPRRVNAASPHQLDGRARERLQCRDRSEALRLRRLSEAKADPVLRRRYRQHICRRRHLSAVSVANRVKQPEQRVQHRRSSVLHRQRRNRAGRQRALLARVQNRVAAPAMFPPAGRGQSSARNSARLRQWARLRLSLAACSSDRRRHRVILQRRRRWADLLLKHAAREDQELLASHPAQQEVGYPPANAARHRVSRKSEEKEASLFRVGKQVARPPLRNAARHRDSRKAERENPKKERHRQVHNKFNRSFDSASGEKLPRYLLFVGTPFVPSTSKERRLGQPLIST
jgi:hypothetical protein